MTDGPEYVMIIKVNPGSSQPEGMKGRKSNSSAARTVAGKETENAAAVGRHKEETVQTGLSALWAGGLPEEPVQGQAEGSACTGRRYHEFHRFQRKGCEFRRSD